MVDYSPPLPGYICIKNMLCVCVALLRYNWPAINCTYLKCTIRWILTYVYTDETLGAISVLTTSTITTGFLCSCVIPPSLLYSLFPFLLAPSLHFLEFHNGIMECILFFWSDFFHSAALFHPCVWDIHFFFSFFFSLLIWWITLIDFLVLKPTFPSCDKLHLEFVPSKTWVKYYPFYVLLDSIC